MKFLQEVDMFEKAYIDYLIQFHCQRDYFECHEILEERWKLDKKEQRKRHWLGLIQIAVGMYHYRRENWNGARKMFTSALHIAQEEDHELTKLGIVVEDLTVMLEEQLTNIQEQVKYQSVNLPLTHILLHECFLQCKKDRLIWGSSSDLSNKYLVHKHMLRER